MKDKLMLSPLKVDFFINHKNKLKKLAYARAKNIVYCSLFMGITLLLLSYIYYTLNAMTNFFAMFVFEIPVIISLLIMKFSNRPRLASYIIIINLYLLLNWIMLYQGGILS